MVLDGAGWHHSASLRLPGNLRLLACRRIRPGSILLSISGTGCGKNPFTNYLFTGNVSGPACASEDGVTLSVDLFLPDREEASTNGNSDQKIKAVERTQKTRLPGYYLADPDKGEAMRFAGHVTQ